MNRTDAAKVALRQMIYALAPCWGGMAVVVVMSLAVTEPTEKTYIGWALIAVGIPAFIFSVSYFMCRRQS